MQDHLGKEGLISPFLINSVHISENYVFNVYEIKKFSISKISERSQNILRRFIKVL